MELKENLSKNLILLRGPKSQAAFSEKLGVTKSTIQAIEAKKSAVRLDTLDIIARNLGLPAPALLSEELTWEGAKLLPYILERAEWFVQLSNRDRNDILCWLQDTVNVWQRILGNRKEESTAGVSCCSAWASLPTIRAFTFYSPVWNCFKTTRWLYFR